MNHKEKNGNLTVEKAGGAPLTQWSRLTPPVMRLVHVTYPCHDLLRRTQ